MINILFGVGFGNRFSGIVAFNVDEKLSSIHLFYWER